MICWVFFSFLYVFFLFSFFSRGFFQADINWNKSPEPQEARKEAKALKLPPPPVLCGRRLGWKDAGMAMQSTAACCKQL